MQRIRVLIVWFTSAALAVVMALCTGEAPASARSAIELRGPSDAQSTAGWEDAPCAESESEPEDGESEDLIHADEYLFVGAGRLTHGLNPPGHAAPQRRAPVSMLGRERGAPPVPPPLV